MSVGWILSLLVGKTKVFGRLTLSTVFNSLPLPFTLLSLIFASFHAKMPSLTVWLTRDLAITTARLKYDNEPPKIERQLSVYNARFSWVDKQQNQKIEMRTPSKSRKLIGKSISK